MDKSINLLKFWHDLEYFSPFFPNSEKESVIITSSTQPYNSLPWLLPPVPSQIRTYDVYLGKIMSRDLINMMLEVINNNDDAIERNNADCCVCAFKIGNDGRYIENSFSVSRFVWAMSKIIAAQTLDVSFKMLELANFNIDCNDALVSLFGNETPIEYSDLTNSFRVVWQELALNRERSIKTYIHINPKYTKKRETNRTDIKNEQEIVNQIEEKELEIHNPLLNPNTEMIPSFFATDINMIKKQIQPQDKIIRYIEALINPIKERIEIDTDVEQMKKWLEPGRYPLGKWPSENSPSLMQQIAVNIAISNREARKILSVNGPPGTGKTTLLKEIIAANLANRALLLFEYDHPDDAFCKCLFKNPPEPYLHTFYHPDDCLSEYGIIIASSNNKAVENISKELPLASELIKGKPLSPVFNLEKNDEIYFSELATHVMGNEQKCWGLISAPLGKRSNLQAFKDRLWFNDENKGPASSLQYIYNNTAEIPDWEQTRKDFKDKYEEVLKYRRSIQEAIDHLKVHKKFAQKRSESSEILSSAAKELKFKEDEYARISSKQQHMKQKRNMLSDNLALLNSRLSFFKKHFPCLFKKDPYIIKRDQASQELDEATGMLVTINRALYDLKTELDEKEQEHQNAENEYKEIDAIFQESNKKVEEYKKHFGANFADDNFWLNISSETSQIACPWTNSDYDRLREELFYQALKLHKTFVLNSKHVKQNLRCLMSMWNNCFTEEDKHLAYTDLLNTLFLLVPAVSTTFAAVSSFLNHIRKDGLGLLIIDEGGQAAPQYALGALWRTQKAIVVGDPLQIEPFSTVPQELFNKFADKHSIDATYRTQVISAQVLADQINPYGGFRSDSENHETWLGCPLVMHRRCIEPMFSISNKIAYGNRMYKQSREPDPGTLLSIEKSVWIDIKGTEEGGKNHFVEEQGKTAVNMVLAAFELAETRNGNIPDIYIISPFSTVANRTKKLMGKYLSDRYRHFFKKNTLDNWLNESCGTIHTFQGKEANEVILILGCDTNTGKGAANWAGSKPNILNVALTRAKYRIAIIGDSDVWKDIPYFKIAYKRLPKK